MGVPAATRQRPPQAPPPAATTYSIGGTISDLASAGLVLKNNGADDLIVNAGATGFTFLTKLEDGASYNVTVSANPTGLGCSVNNGSGTIAAANVTDVQINCVPKYDLVSRSDDNTVFASRLGFQDMSSDGRFIVYEGAGVGLANGTTAISKQIMMRDRLTNTTTLISRASGANGVEGNNDSYEPAVSDDGRYVVFQSYADNLVAGDLKGYSDIFIRDTQLQTTTRLSVGFDGSEADFTSLSPAISGDGHYVAFISYAHNIVNTTYGDLYLLDRQTQAITSIALAADGSSPNGYINYPSVSADGSRIAFVSNASNLGPVDTNGADDVYVYDRATGKNLLVSVSTAGGQTNNTHRVLPPTISNNGNIVAFATDSPGMVSGDTNGLQDVFLRNLTTNTTVCASVNSLGAVGNGDSPQAQKERIGLSSDGSIVAFSTYATNLAADASSGESVMTHNTTTKLTSTIYNSPSWYAGTYGPSLSGDGRFVGFLSSEYLDPRFATQSGIYVRDLTIQ